MKRIASLLAMGAVILAACAPQGVATPPASITCGTAPDGSIIYVVQSSDTLQAIADACGSTVETIRALNDLTGDSLNAGQTLIVKRPADSAEATSPPPTGAAGPTATAPSQDELVQRAITIQTDDWARGPENAAVTIIEWGDFQ